MFHISFYVPAKDAEKVKDAMFQAGGGRLGNYDSCAFEIRGIGQFRPLPGSHPHIGHQEVLERVEEIKVEMVCDDSRVEDVVKALKAAHPYETPAYYVIKTLGF